MDENILLPALIDQWKQAPNIEDNLPSMKKVNNNLSMKFEFPWLEDTSRKEISQLFVSHFPEASVEYKCTLLELIRILGRDKTTTSVTQLFSEDLIKLILQAGGIYPNANTESFLVVMGGTMCLINALFNSVVARTIFEENCEGILVSRIDQILKELQKSEEPIPDKFAYLKDGDTTQLETLLFFDLRMAFVTSAHSIELQKKWVEDTEKTDVFLSVLKFACNRLPIMEPRRSEWATEASKVLFNLYCHAQVYDFEFAQECAHECARLVMSTLVEDDMKQNAVHVLALLPSCLPALCPKLDESEKKDFNLTKIYEDYDMRFVDATLEVLSRKLDKTTDAELDLLALFFKILIQLCQDHKAARRYCRLKVLPPMKAHDVERPPDEGVTLRNKIIRLMTTTGHCKDMAAGFLFVLCKRSVPRLIKYTGLGHSAGLLANEGCLGQINDQKRESDSEDSETESYNEVRDRVHPVTGYIQPERENPLANMSDEQKEYEAMKLANAMDKLMSEGIFTPSTIGPDGKPIAVSHVNELLKNLPSEEEKGSDSDE